MGMNLVVGVFPALYAEAEEEARTACREEFRALNRALRAAGLPAHEEPETAREGTPWNCRIGSWTCLGLLRRVAASLALGRGLPEPTDWPRRHEAVIDDYYAACKLRPLRRPGRAQTAAAAYQPSLSFGPAGLSGATQVELPMALPPPAVKRVAGPDFTHLMWHSAASGYYLPVPFPEVLVPPRKPDDEWASAVGSSQRLLRECELLAVALGYPRDLEVDALRAVEPEPEGRGWKRYAIESFMCRALIEGCRVSIRSGSALVFC
jgi:hypothetical protein